MTDDFDTFRRIYGDFDIHKRTIWSAARRLFLLITSCGANVIMTTKSGVTVNDFHHASAAVIIDGAKAQAQELFISVPSEPTSNDPRILEAFRRKADRDDPYRFVVGAERWLNEARWQHWGDEERTKLASDYNARKIREAARKSNIRLVG